MKLRNKKTGEIADLSVGCIRDAHNGEFIQVKLVACLEDKGSYLYDTFVKFSEDWEDYKPKEPLIKDEKIRKAVRAWAEAIEANEVIISHSRHDYLKIIDLNADCDICFDYEIGYTYNETNYTITELCGEGEE